ncbi:MAG: hypothetical protein ACRDSK_14610 [Actinophytocola sp.]|uniref:hypothetical protein n=1 Tax=Actinophytocola sp. TaxID=1872138 RepID=UPI003D6ACDD1
MAALLVLNTMSIVVFQVQARRVTDLTTAARQVRAAGVVLLVACVMFALSALGSSATLAVAVLVLAAGLQSLGSLFVAAGVATVRAVRAARARLPENSFA